MLDLVRNPQRRFSHKAAHLVAGAAYTSECMKCPAGSYSSKGAGECSYCQENTYSDEGAAMCTPCDKATQWSSMYQKKR